ncbi:small heat shock protein, chloroplastic-like [Quercus robur]|uniref:small heat shock protein, chloroplastic-like n=1 Tax=Quercus robur TaxID=38942 RepID=UPI002162DC99|nr:small heat shock protein, chloroplastic-like [Quercus robur]
MASSIALRRVAAPTLLSKLFNPIRSISLAPSLSRSFNTNTQLSKFDDHDDVDRRSDQSITRRRGPAFFTDVFDPFSTTRSLSQVLNLMDQFIEDPFLAASRGVGAGSKRGSWDVKEDNDALYIRLDMPGLGKEDVTVSVEESTLIIKGEGEKLSEEDEESKRKYTSRLDLPPKLYKLDSIKAEMKNGVLKVLVPKIKEEEKKDVFHVNIE